MTKKQKILLAVFLVVYVLVLVGTYPSILSIVLIMAGVLSLPIVLVQKFLNQ